MTLITPDYLEQQKELHARGNYGISSGKWAATISGLAQSYGCQEILDYGCGTGQLKQSLGSIVREYDPCLPGKDADPAPADMVVCTDVLEHIEPHLLDDVLSHLVSKAKKALFFTVALRPAGKVLADGRNAHLIIESADWWKARLSKHIQITEWNAKEGVEACGVAIKPGAEGRTGIRGNKQRRKLNRKEQKKFEAFFETLKEGTRRYSDPMCAIDSYSFWEGVDDREADCQFVVDILEHQWDVDAALLDIKRLTKRAALICIKPDFRGRDYWEDVIGHYFHVSEVVEGGGMLSFVANTRTIIVPGSKIVPAGTDETRWQNIVAAIGKYPGIVEEAPAHNRRAIIACYGPSLKDTWADLKTRADADPDSDIISVSGSHDFLLERGIKPRYHIECDPRPHKANNIAKANPETEYLLASICSPVLFDKLDGANIRLWHTSDGETARRIVDELKSKAPLIFGGGSVGLRSIPVMYRMGYRKFDIYGMDCSFSDDGSEKWAGAHAQKANPKEFPLVRAVYEGRVFTTTGILLTYGADFFDMMNRMLERDPSIVAKVYGDGLLQARVNGPQTPIKLLLDEAA